MDKCALDKATAGQADGQDAETSPVPTFHLPVVDDVMMNRDITVSFLRSADHTGVCVEAGWKAVAAAAGTDFDVGRMDVHRPATVQA
jgi:CheY-like chemotaxis protein